MTRNALTLTLLAAAALAGCSKEDHTIVGGPGANDEQANVAANAPVELPPAIAATKIYRCSGDNSVVYVDWLADNKSANLRTEKGGTPTHVAAPEAGQPLTAEGYSLEGSASASSIKITLPGKGSKSCKA